MPPQELKLGRHEYGKEANHSSHKMNVRLARCKDRYVLAQRTRRRNDLMMFVGFLEFFNCLDFPANVWNEIPVRRFVMALMITGGTTILLASIGAFIDLRRSWKNVQLLREERAFLRVELEHAQSKSLPYHHLEAWLSVNFRELGWELFDRTFQDAVIGFGGILVGIGTLLAVSGANPQIFLASNLLSGYVGNGFIAFYGALNAVWSVYLWKRARRHNHAVRGFITDPTVRKRERSVFRNHEIYALVNGFNLVVSGIGSLMSATMWYGYVILIPCVVAAVFCNVFWRRKVGYDRLMIPYRPIGVNDICQQISNAIAAQNQLRNPSDDSTFAQYSRDALLEFLVDNEMLEDFCVHLVNNSAYEQLAMRNHPETVEINMQALETITHSLFLKVFKSCVDQVGQRRALDQERMLYELLGAYLSIPSDPVTDIQTRNSSESDLNDSPREDYEKSNAQMPILEHAVKNSTASGMTAGKE